MRASFPSVTPTSSSRTATALVHLSFVLTGVMTTFLGPMLPVLSARWQLNDTQAGYLFTAQFATSIVGVALSSVAIERYGYRAPLLLGLVLMALGAGVLAEATWMVGIASVCLYGAGLGLTIPTANLLVAAVNPRHRAAALNLLNFSWGIGAVGCPFAIAVLQRSQRTHLFFYGMAAALGLLAVCMAGVPFSADASEERVKPVRGASPALWKSRFVPILGALFFIYVGTESSLGGWVASYAQRVDSSSRTFWAMTPSFFWGALLLGRALAPVLLRHIRETNLASAGLAVASLGVIVLLAANTMAYVVLGASLAGWGLASVYPINIAMLSLWFGEMANRMGGAMFALAGLGGASLPWLVGVLSNHFGSLKIGLTVPLLGAAIMLVLYLAHGSSRPLDTATTS